MSQHHRRQKWTTHVAKLRPLHEASLPRPCLCGCGYVITRETPRAEWHVGHRVDAARGGKPTLANTGPVRRGCNLKAGGRLGARIVNARRRRAQDIRPW